MAKSAPHHARKTLQGWQPVNFACAHCGKIVSKADRPSMGVRQFLELTYCSYDCSGAARRGDALGRFADSYSVDENGCWLWTRSLTAKGYGRFWDGAHVVAAHRFSYLHHNGNIGARIVRHKCDTPRCVNPEHLELGTQAQNINDAVERGRHATGAKHASSKITEDDVRAIRLSNATLRELSDRYGLSQGTLSMIRNRKTWRGVE